MNRRQPVCLLIATIVIAYVPSLVTAAGDDGLVAHYPFDGDTLDISGNDNHAASHGGVSFVLGVHGGAVSFDGSSGYLEADGDGPLALSQWTISVWVNPRANTDSQAMLVGKPNQSNRFNYNLSFASPSQVRSRYESNQTSDDRDFIVEGPQLTLDTWTHVVSTRDGSGNHCLYINGAQYDCELHTAAPAANTAPLWMGKWYSPPLNLFFTGELDDVRIYNRALSAAEVRDLFSGGTSTTITYVALGDSYSSGEGVGIYDPKTDKKDGNSCHQSDQYAWSGERPGGDRRAKILPESTTRELIACSGSRSRHLWGPRFFGKSGRGDTDGDGNCDVGEVCVEAQFDESSLLATADLVTVTIGGNDLVTGDRDDADGMFTSLISECVVFDNCTPGDTIGDELLGNWALKILNHLNDDEATPGSLRYTIKKIKEEAPQATIMVVSYPQLFWDNPVENGCGNEGFNAREMSWLNEFAVDLQGIIRCAADEQGVVHVPVSFGKRAHCKDNQSHRPALNGMNFLSRIFNWTRFKESMHPNPLGQNAIAQAVRMKLPDGGASGELPDNPPPKPCSWTPGFWNHSKMETLSTPTHGGTLYMESTVPGCGLVEHTFVAGQQVLLSGGGFAPSTTVNLRIRASLGAYDRDLGAIGTDSPLEI